MLTLIDSTVRVTIRHSDNAPIASESRDRVGQPGRGDGRRAAVKACSAGRPYHGLNPSRRGRITRDVGNFAAIAGNIAAAARPENGKMAARKAVMPAIFVA